MHPCSIAMYFLVAQNLNFQKLHSNIYINWIMWHCVIEKRNSVSHQQRIIPQLCSYLKTIPPSVFNYYLLQEFDVYFSKGSHMMNLFVSWICHHNCCCCIILLFCFNLPSFCSDYSNHIFYFHTVDSSLRLFASMQMNTQTSRVHATSTAPCGNNQIYVLYIFLRRWSRPKQR